ncbi:hypothetical protein EKO04_002730 [Ascochyta lentis]|uniref:Uncharacterized protein n=1 Tax=Ascochyta lentis TaxID=205686 RepID=A0A8H7JB73_9PLEO|nr:hypothetical protein EKO04_002730 [Ascochyta lentis]
MEPKKRLLGVFVPKQSGKPVDLVEQAYVLAPPPFSTERRLQLDFPPDYEKENIVTLLNMARGRRIDLEVDVIKARLILYLRRTDDKDRRKHKAWLADAAFHIKNKNQPDLLLERHYCSLWYCEQFLIDEKLADRLDQTLASTYTADPSRKSFMDLPAEVRNMIYGFSMFSSKVSPVWKLSNCSRRNGRLEHALYFGSENSSRRFHVALSTSTLGLLSAMSTQIRHETRSYFWAKLKFRLSPDCDIVQFLETIGPDGRASIPELDKYPGNLGSTKHGPEGAASFQGLLQKLKTCVGLQSIILELNISNIFYQDVEALRDFLIGGKKLLSPGLENLATILTSLPRLKYVFLKVESCVQRGGGCHLCGPWHQEHDKFLRFAFSGKRQGLLWKEVEKRLQARHTQVEQLGSWDNNDNQNVNDGENGDEDSYAKLDGRIFVRIDYANWKSETHIENGDLLDYQSWLQTSAARD